MYIMIWRSLSSASTAFSMVRSFGIRKIERDAEHRLLIGTPPLVGEVANRPERLQATAIELVVQLIDVLLNRRAFHPQAELADLLAEHAANLGIERLEPGHPAIIAAFSRIT